MADKSTCRVTFLPDGRTIQVRTGTSLLEAARRARVDIRSRCGGQASCLMCKVTVEASESVLPVQANERRKLGEADPGLRLACQARVAADAVVFVPEDPLKAIIRAKLAQAKEGDER